MQSGISARVRILVVLSLTLLTLPLSAGVSYGQAGAIQKVIVAQALGNQSDKFVAGKETGVLVYLDGPVAVDPAQQKVEVKLAGDTVATLEPSPSVGPTNPLVFQCASRAA